MSTPNMRAIREAGGKNAYELPPGAVPPGKHYQWVSATVVGQREFGALEEFKKRGWMPVPAERHADLYITLPGQLIEVGGQVLVEKDVSAVEETKRDELIMNLLATAAARAAFMQAGSAAAKVINGVPFAVFNGNSVKEAWQSIRDAYADKEFREKHRGLIRRRARALAIDANMAPDATISLEPLLHRLVEEVGLSVWYVAADRLVETWRIFEPQATAELKKEIKP